MPALMLNRRWRRAPCSGSACVIPTQIILFGLLSGSLPGADLALRISSETAPAGGWAQIKISPATPQLVAGGRLVMTFDPAVFGSIASVAVFSAQGDAVGIATVSGQSLDVFFSSAAGGIAQLPHLPILTVTLPILASATAGTVSVIALDASLDAGNAPPGAQRAWTDVRNNTYSVTATPGSVTVGGSLSIRNLVPGGGLLPAGTLVRVNGTGFSAGTAASIDGVSVSNVQFVGTGEIDLTLGGAADLTGKSVVLRNPDGAQVEYFSAAPSVPDLPTENLAPGVQPLLSMQTWRSASATFTERGGVIALQNPNPTAVDVLLQTRSVISNMAGQTTVTIPPGALNFYATRATGIQGAIGFRAFASLPLRMLGMGYALDALYMPGVLPVLPPLQQLTARPAAVSFQWQVGTAVPAAVSVLLAATDFSSNFTFRATSPDARFSVTPTQTTAPATITVTANPVGLSPGTYSGNIILTPEGPNAAVTTIPLSLTVSTAALLVPNPQSLTFAGDSSQALKVDSNGSPTAFTVAAVNGAGQQWLTVSPSGGTTPAQLAVTTRSANLNAGVYSGQIVITGPNNTVTVAVQLSVSEPNNFGFSPSSVTFSARTGSDPPSPQTVLVYGASTGAAFSVSTNSGGPWLSATKTASGQPGAVITANPAGLAAGTYSGTVAVTSPVSPPPAPLPVILVVWDKEPALTVTPPSVTFTVSLEDLQQDVSQPSPLLQPHFQVSSGGVPMNFTVGGSPEVFTTPASISAPAVGYGVPGSYERDITIAAGSQKVVVPVTTIVTTGALTPPFLGSVVNAASQLPGSVAGGEILSIYGFGAGPSNTAGFTLDPSGKVATSLNGAQILFDGRPAPVIYGSASQANVMVPYEVANHATTTISLQYGGVTSAGWAIPVAPSAPGVFALGSAGLGPAAVLNQDNSVNGVSNPAVRGSVIQIYATGEGETSPRGVTGSVIGTDLKTPVLAVKVTIGGQDAVVQYAGSAGGSVAGLFQVNAVVPQSLSPGAAVPISVSVGGVPSQSGVTIAVH